MTCTMRSLRESNSTEFWKQPEDYVLVEVVCEMASQTPVLELYGLFDLFVVYRGQGVRHVSDFLYLVPTDQFFQSLFVFFEYSSRRTRLLESPQLTPQFHPSFRFGRLFVSVWLYLILSLQQQIRRQRLFNVEQQVDGELEVQFFEELDFGGQQLVVRVVFDHMLHLRIDFSEFLKQLLLLEFGKNHFLNTVDDSSVEVSR